MEQKNSSNDTVSSQKSLPSSYDSGWNDPPEWALSLQHNSSKTKKLLNKRVAFPLSSQTSTAEKVSSSLPSNTPPILQSSMVPTITTAPYKPLVASMDKKFTTMTLDSDFDKDQALTEVLTNLKSVMTGQKMEMNMIEEIEKRLDIMETDWRENKLNNMIHRSVLDISKALLRKDIEQANKIHIALMTQHVTACRTWIPAIRHIIFELKKECENSNVSQPEQSPLLSVELKKK
ncbi:Steroid receptor RNA activator 1 [Camponotus floridanus]|uniref:Steroid receptor RNA activator 1 n=2 Tax=Camponotus floridanus TaxID=104421 RepID=E2A0C3_CAMFO|nr:Steroid receptor RNA activator 1 [Camponotus floridanus]